MGEELLAWTPRQSTMMQDTHKTTCGRAPASIVCKKNGMAWCNTVKRTGNRPDGHARGPMVASASGYKRRSPKSHGCCSGTTLLTIFLRSFLQYCLSSRLFHSADQCVVDTSICNTQFLFYKTTFLEARMPDEDIVLLPMWQDFCFRPVEHEKKFKQQLYNAKVMAAKQAVVGLIHLSGFIAMVRLHGLGVAWVYLVVPVGVAFHFLVLYRCRSWAFRWTSYTNSLICLMAFFTEMFGTHRLAAEYTAAYAATFGPTSRHLLLQEAASQRALWPNLFFASLTLLLSTNTVFDKATLLLHIALPAALSLTIALSSNLVFSAPILLSCIVFTATSLWLNVDRTFTLRKLFMAEMATHKAREAEVVHMEAAREADNVLNHSLKNAMADSTGLIGLFLTNPSQQRLSLLAQAQERLQWGMQWCKKRLAITKLTSGSYVPKMVSVSLQAFVNMLAQGRDVHVVPFEGRSVMLDETGCAVMLENVLSNASRHGDPAGPDVRLRVELHHDPDAEPGHPLNSDLVFEVTNRADPAKPRVNDEFVTKALRGEGPHSLQPSSSLSEGLGLQHIFLAAQTLGIDASLRQETDVVVFRACARVQVLPNPQTTGGTSPQNSGSCPPTLPPGLTFCCLDDSAVACRVVAANIEARVPGSTVRQFGQKRDEVDAFMAAVVAGASVAIVDQHLVYGATTIYGTDLLRRLLDANYQGLLCIRSANASESDERLYRKCGAHCVLDKADQAAEVVRAITVAYWNHFGEAGRE